MPTEDQAVRLLEELGLTEYEARCFVALSRVRTATAKEVSDLSDVPRSRVYDAVDRLHKRGLVDVQQSDPREYQAIPHEEALEILREEYASSVQDAGDAFEQLRSSETQEETGAWAIAEHEHVIDRMTRLIDDAEDEVYLLVVESELVDDSFIDSLAVLEDRGVSIIVEVPSGDLEGRFASAIPDATVTATTLAELQSEVEGNRLGRILMVDRSSVLISSVSDGVRPDRSKETAIWASGPDHGLVVGLRHLIGVRIDNPDVLQELD